MSRSTNEKYSPLAKDYLDNFHSNVVQEVQKTVSEQDVIVIGMFLNPHVYAVKMALQKKNIPFTYLQYGGYFTKWKQRLAIKMWSGWPTFPQVFVKGTLMGGNKKTQQSLNDGSLQKLLLEN
jgi:monothiol glutaredoxin